MASTSLIIIKILMILPSVSLGFLLCTISENNRSGRTTDPPAEGPSLDAVT